MRPFVAFTNVLLWHIFHATGMAQISDAIGKYVDKVARKNLLTSDESMNVEAPKRAVFTTLSSKNSLTLFPLSLICVCRLICVLGLCVCRLLCGCILC